jgi:hypothetical protein
MNRVAVFGNAGGGKSALAQRLAELTGLPLYVVDIMQFRPGGAKVPHDEFLQAHADILRRDEWIIDGFGNMAIAWDRFAAADTLIHVDLPLHSFPMDNQASNQRAVRRPARRQKTVRYGAAPCKAIAYSGSATGTSHPDTGGSWRRKPHRRGCTT